MNEPRSEEYIYFDRIKTKLDPNLKMTFSLKYMSIQKIQQIIKLI